MTPPPAQTTISTSPRPNRTSEETRGRDALASLRIDRPDSGDERKSGRKWTWVIALLLILGAGGFGYRQIVNNGRTTEAIFGGGSNWVPEIMQNRVEVRLASVTVQQGRSADAVVVATGYLQSHRQARIGAQAAGRINIVFFEEGNRVSKDEILAELDHKDLDASLAAAAASVTRAKAALAEQQIAIEQAEVDKNRAEVLWGTRGIAESEYENAKFTHLSAVARMHSMEAEVALAEAQRQQAEQLKANMFIRAPFDGTVISKDAEVGESILPGGMGGGSGRGSVATIADLENLEIECDVQEDFISRVSEGQEADVAIDAVQTKKYHGTVRKIIPMGDRARSTIKVRVAIDDADELLFPEMAGTVYFLPTDKEWEVSDEPRIFCPSTAVDSDEEGQQFVWVADQDKHAQKISVETGAARDGRTEIVAGLTGNERVIVNPHELHEGAPVQITE